MNCVQTEELLTKRRDLLEKKIGIELQRAKDASAAKNKRGKLQNLAFPNTDAINRKVNFGRRGLTA